VHEAEELVQEALLRAYTHREQLQTEEDLSAWTTVVAGRLVIDRLRVRGRSTSVADVPDGRLVGRDTAEIVVARDEARTALDALDAMPARQAALLWAREVEGRSYQDLCERFTMSEPAVRSVLTRARKALRKEYALRGGTLPVGGLAVLAPWVASLGWADRLRRVASRVTAPAALGAVGITALGGLILSPFGAYTTPGPGTFHPSQSVVKSSSSKVDLPAGVNHATSTRPLRAANSVTLQPHVPARTRIGLFSGADQTCRTGTSSSGAGVGGKSCSGIVPKHQLYLNQPLPRVVAAPTGYDYLNVETTDNTCKTLLKNPLLKCTDGTQP
jgi:RNA polymerase sigma-70 factor (ECF subfamily)